MQLNPRLIAEIIHLRHIDKIDRNRAQGKLMSMIPEPEPDYIENLLTFFDPHLEVILSHHMGRADNLQITSQEYGAHICGPEWRKQVDGVDEFFIDIIQIDFRVDG